MFRSPSSKASKASQPQMRGAVTTEAMGSINQQQPRRRAKDISSYFVVPKARQASQGNADFLGSSRTPFFGSVFLTWIRCEQN